MAVYRSVKPVRSSIQLNIIIHNIYQGLNSNKPLYTNIDKESWFVHVFKILSVLL
jgi:hypothetical protein